jgi:hypothetical protein
MWRHRGTLSSWAIVQETARRILPLHPEASGGWGSHCGHKSHRACSTSMLGPVTPSTVSPVSPRHWPPARGVLCHRVTICSRPQVWGYWSIASFSGSMSVRLLSTSGNTGSGRSYRLYFSACQVKPIVGDERHVRSKALCGGWVNLQVTVWSGNRSLPLSHTPDAACVVAWDFLGCGCRAGHSASSRELFYWDM